MARRRKKSHRKTRSRRRNPSHRRRRSHSRRKGSSRRRRSNPGRRKAHGCRRRYSNPLSGFSPSNTLKQLTQTAVPVVLGYLGVNLTWMVAKRIIAATMADKWAALSPTIQGAVEAGVSLFIGVPASTYLGGKLTKGKAGLVAAGALANAGLTLIDAVVANVPGLPDWVHTDLLGNWPGGGGVFGAGDYLTAAQQPPGVSGFGPMVRRSGGMGDYMTAGGRGTSHLPAIAGGGRGAF